MNRTGVAERRGGAASVLTGRALLHAAQQGQAPGVATTGNGARISVAIADDEPLARKGLRAALAQEPDLDVIAECRDGEEVIAAVAARRPDLLFLDIQMPNLDGFATAERLARPAPLVIFVTAFDRHAVRAFESQGIDYLLKPFSTPRLKTALERARLCLKHRTQQAGPDRLPPGGDYLSQFSVRSKDLMTFVPAQQVDWIEAACNYIVLHVGRKTHILRENIGAVELKLDPAMFLRVSRSAIVRLGTIRHIDTTFNGQYELILADGTRVKTSRTLSELGPLLRNL